MSAVGRRGTTIILLWALLVTAVGVASLAVVGQPARHPQAAPLRPPPTTSPSRPSTTVVITTTPPPAAPIAAVGAGSGPSVVLGGDAPVSFPPTSAAAPSRGTVGAPSLAVACHPDLALELSPDAPYSFLCTRGTTPVTWPSDSIRLFTIGLDPSQTAALQVALAQWETQARFTVTRVDSTAAANVVMTSDALNNNEDGYTSMHYVCAATCAFDHADVRLASSAALTKTSWISTILHELGHVAGLNHVSRHSEVMYPEIDAQAPTVYGSGDLAGFQELEKVRPST